MKKLISMVLTAAMVASVVPATAFAADIEATAKVVHALDFTKDEAKGGCVIDDADGDHPELKITMDKVDVQKNTTTAVDFTVELALDNAKWDSDVTVAKFEDGTLVKAWDDDGTRNNEVSVVVGSVDFDAVDRDYVKFKVAFDPADDEFDSNDYITIDLDTVLTKWSVGTLATVTVDGVAVADDLVFASVEARGITAETRKVAKVAEEEWVKLDKDIVVSSNVGNFADNHVFELKLSNGFEFHEDTFDATVAGAYTLDKDEDDIAILTLDSVVDPIDEFKILAEDIVIEATSAKAGATCVMTIKALKGETANDWSAKTTVEVMEVVDYTVILSVDEDEDVPVIYSGVNVDNFGLTDDSDHMSLEITAEETFPGAWSFRKGFNFELPEGVWVTDVEILEAEGFLKSAAVGPESTIGPDEMLAAFFNAYQDGDHVNFEFEKRVFDDVDAELYDTKAKVVFQLELVAEPGYVGDVTLKLNGELVDEQEVVIANFATPYYVSAEQNDMKIDYRYTEVPTVITITEAEAGLWKADEAGFALIMEHGNDANFMGFEDATLTVDEESGMELEDDDDVRNGAIVAVVDRESDAPATITISDIQMFMSRSIPAGPYDLEGSTTMAAALLAQPLFAADHYDEDAATSGVQLGDDYYVGAYDDVDGSYENLTCVLDDETVEFYGTDWFVGDMSHSGECYVADVEDFETTVKEAFINVVTAGREQDDNSFTTIVKVPVGENVLYAGEVTVELDVPAYINANGYTMLPVRAVATALGINNNNVLWDQATKTVTILYGQRIITMQVGANVVYVNGSAIPATSSVEIVDGRTFLGLRDLATALGVTTIDWDAASKTALLNAEFEA